LVYAARRVSPSKRKRPTTGKGKSESASKRAFDPAPLQRLGLLIFGVAFVVLFVGFAIAEGIGQPSVLSGDVAIVEDVPSDLGTITQADYQKSLVQTASRAGLKALPKPGDKQYEDLKKAALGDLLDSIWIQGEAAEMGISVTPQQISTEFAQIKKQNFKTKAEYAKFLATSHFTQADVDQRVKLQLLSTQIQQQIGKGVPTPSSSQIEDYYNAAKSQFTQPATRDVRLVLNKDKAKVEQAKAALDKNDSTASWQRVAKQYSTDPSSKTNGGLRAGLSSGLIEEPLNSAIFSASQGEVLGPVKTSLGYYVFEVEKVTPESVQPLAQVQSQISSQLTQQAQQDAFSAFIANYGSKWQSRTFCASDYVIERCSNFKGTGHPASAPPACYEANPKGGLPDACPAPVQQLAPAVPGSVTILTPQGQRLPQRPNPGPAGAVSTGSLPSGVVPGATGAPPPSP
jgi:parvulin-like peptidyl-prolyl isomerase